MRLLSHFVVPGLIWLTTYLTTKYYLVNYSQLAQMKMIDSLKTCPCHIYGVKAIGLSLFKFTFENYDICEYIKFGAIS